MSSLITFPHIKAAYSAVQAGLSIGQKCFPGAQYQILEFKTFQWVLDTATLATDYRELYQAISTPVAGPGANQSWNWPRIKTTIAVAALFVSIILMLVPSYSKSAYKSVIREGLRFSIEWTKERLPTVILFNRAVVSGLLALDSHQKFNFQDRNTYIFSAISQIFDMAINFSTTKTKMTVVDQESIAVSVDFYLPSSYHGRSIPKEVQSKLEELMVGFYNAFGSPDIAAAMKRLKTVADDLWPQYRIAVDLTESKIEI